MGQVYEGQLVDDGFAFAIVVARWNEFITAKLLGGAQDALRRHGVDESRVDLAWVPGSFEIPIVAQRLARSGRYQAVICLGAVIRGATPHFDYVAAEVSKGVAQAGLQTGVPVVFGVLTTDTIEQAVERAGTKAGNKGFEAAVTAIEMASLLRAIDDERAVGSGPTSGQWAVGSGQQAAGSRQLPVGTDESAASSPQQVATSRP